MAQFLGQIITLSQMAAEKPTDLKEVSDPSDPVIKILDKLEADAIGIVQGADMLLAAFRAQGNLYDLQINSRMIGWDPSNRDAQGGNAQHVHELASDIAFVGWSWPETDDALCAEIVPGDKEVEQLNQKLVEDSEPELAPVEADSIHFGSLACGHTNQALRCVQAGVASSCPMLSQDGHMSLAKLEARDPHYAEAVTQGLKWKVLRWRVRILYPRVLHVLQAARNVSGHVQRKINEMQGLSQMHKLAASCQKAGRPTDWLKIKRAVLRTRPPFVESMDSLVAFVIAKAGGSDGKYLRYLVAFHRQFVNPSIRESVPAPVWSGLAEMKHQYLAIALLEMTLTCPSEYVRGGSCQWLTLAEVSGLTKDKKQRKTISCCRQQSWRRRS